MEIKPLLVYLQAGDYPEVLEPLKEIPCDKLILKYMAYPWPHDLAREFFLQHEEYTHLIIHPQDLVVTKEDYFKLYNDIRKYNFPVLSGVCNVSNHGKFKALWSISKKLPSLIHNKRYYEFMPMGEGLGIIDVKFQGFIFCFIKRNVIERTTINGDYIFRGAIHINGGAAPDLTFCHNCDEIGVKIYVDTNVRMKHLATHKDILVFKKDFEILFIKGKEIIKNPLILR